MTIYSKNAIVAHWLDVEHGNYDVPVLTLSGKFTWVGDLTLKERGNEPGNGVTNLWSPLRLNEIPDDDGLKKAGRGVYGEPSWIRAGFGVVMGGDGYFVPYRLEDGIPVIPCFDCSIWNLECECPDR